MRTLISRLVGIEQIAAEVYRDAAIALRDAAPELSAFLAEQAADEAEHRNVLLRAARHVGAVGDLFPSAVALDPTTEARILAPFEELRAALTAGSLTPALAIRDLVVAESSEWNDFFLLVVETLKRASREFQVAAARIQRHRRKIERFLESFPMYPEALDALRRAPRVWTPAVLVVEDSPPVAELLLAVLGTDHAVDSADNGRAALRKVTERHFDVILSDVQMPVMDGVEFYRHAVEAIPDVGDRFVFFTGSDDHHGFFQRTGLRCLRKPAPIADIRRAVAEVVGADRD